MDFMQSHGRVAEALPPTPSTSTTSSPLRGSGKRKAQPRKRIIDDEMDQPFFTGGGLPDASASAATSEDMAATAIVKEVKREMDEDAASGLDEMFGRRNQMRSCNGGGGSPSSMTSVDAENLLHRLSSIIGMPSMQELLAGQVSSSSSSMGAATLQAALSNHASASDPLLAQFAGGNALFTTPVRSAATGSASVPLIKGERTSSSGTPTSSGEGPSPSSPVDHGMLLNAAAVAAVVAARNGRGGGVPPGPGAAPIKVIPAIPDAMRTQSTRTLTLKRKLFNNNTEALKAAARAISTEERIDLDDLEQFAQVFKKQRIKFGFTQGDVGQALGRRYGTDFSQTTISRFEALNLSFKNMCKLRPLLKAWLTERERFIQEWLTEAERAVAAGANPTDLLRQSASVQASLAPAAATAVAKADGGGGVMRQACPSLSDYLAGSNGASGGVMAMGGGHHGQPPLKKRRKRTNLDTIQKTQLDTEFEANPRPTHTRMVEIADALELDRDVVRVWFCNRRQKVRKQEDERLSMASVMGYSFAAAAAAAQGFGDPTQMQSLDDGEDDEEEEDDVEENLLIPPPVLDPLPPSNGDQQKAPPLGQ